jgi:hypothetical protein
MEALPKLLLSLDVGTETCGASAGWEDQDEIFNIEFETGGTYVKSPELHACLAYFTDDDQWTIGGRCSVLDGIVQFRHLKVGIMGQQPYHQRLVEACDEVQASKSARQLNQERPQREKAFSPSDVLEQLLRYVISVLKARIGNNLRGYKSFEEIPIDFWPTFPVRGGESMKISLMEAARAVGFRVKGISEALAAAYFAMHGEDLTLPHEDEDVTLVLDIGGGTMVWNSYLTFPASHR